MTETLAEKHPAATASEKLANMEREDFGPYIIGKWNAVQDLIVPFRDKVEEGSLTPLEAGRAFACVVGTVFGYNETHGGIFSANPMDLLAAINPGEVYRDRK